MWEAPFEGSASVVDRGEEAWLVRSADVTHRDPHPVLARMPRRSRRGEITDFYTPATLIKSLDITNVVGRIKMPTLVLDYENEQFYPGRPRMMFDRLTGPKDCVKLTAATGAQLHCSPMAPQQHCEVVFDWLRGKPAGS